MTTIGSPLVRFYGASLADPALLSEQGIYYYHDTEDGCFFAERQTTGPPRVYVLSAGEDLYLLDQQTLTAWGADEALTSARLEHMRKQWLKKWPYSPAERSLLGQCVVSQQTDDDESPLAGLVPTAYTTAAGAGATAATGRWLAKFVEAAFLGADPNYQTRYTSLGLHLAPTKAQDSLRTESRQLQLLEALGLVRVQRPRRERGILLKFQQQALVSGINLALAPTFFQTLVF